MPYKRRYRRRRRRRRRRGRVARTRNATALAVTKLQRPLLGNKFKTTMIYAEPQLGSINPGLAGAAASYVFSANGMYDPNITGVGHQPLGFDEMTTMYDHYTVIASKISVTFNNGDATNYQMAGVYLSDRTTTETDVRKIVENGKGIYTQLQPSGSANSTATLVQGCSVSKFLGRPNIMSEDDLRGDSGANPAEQAYFHIWGAPNSGADGGSIGLNVRIEYIAVFTEPKLLNLS